MDLVDNPHDLQFLVRDGCRLAVYRRAAYLEDVALPHYRQGGLSINHRLPLNSAQRLSLSDKKSRSIVSSPILA